MTDPARRAFGVGRPRGNFSVYREKWAPQGGALHEEGGRDSGERAYIGFPKRDGEGWSQ